MNGISIPAPVRDVLIASALIIPLTLAINEGHQQFGTVRGINWSLMVATGLAAFWFGRSAGVWAAVLAAIAFATSTASTTGPSPTAITALLTLGAALSLVWMIGAAHEKPRPRATVGWLPFIQDTKAGRTFWAVRETGDYAADCEAGAAMASELISDIRRQKRPELLGWAVANMVEKGKMTGVEVGFMAEIGRSLANDNPDNPAVKTGVVNGHHNGHAGSIHE